ncbi:MAG: hemerythrin family protein [Bdellovibrionales bacterium]|nr:hemerythrin family protein [Bdellovibrionales bacterium]
MSQLFQWSAEEFGLGVQEMDNEHQILIKKMNKLYDAYEAGAEYLELKGLIEELANYTVEHFRDEEAFMESIGFEGLATHKIIHEQLLKQFTEHVDRFNQAQEIEPKFFDFLKVWLSAHIRGIDMKYAQKEKSLNAG